MPDISVNSLIAAELEALAPAILERSGKVFYTGRSAFERPSHVYVLGLNPGGSPIGQGQETVAADLAQWRSRKVPWSAYVDELWNGARAGASGMQPAVRHLLFGLGLDPRQVPASNLVFVRSNDEAALGSETVQLLEACWPVHQAVIESLGVRAILCFGRTAGQWVRDRLDAHHLVGSYRETNKRRWRSEAHQAADLSAVVTLTHPGRADWRNADADPTHFVATVLRRVSTAPPQLPVGP